MMIPIGKVYFRKKKNQKHLKQSYLTGLSLSIIRQTVIAMLIAIQTQTGN